MVHFRKSITFLKILQSCCLIPRTEGLPVFPGLFLRFFSGPKLFLTDNCVGLRHLFRARKTLEVPGEVH